MSVPCGFVLYSKSKESLRVRVVIPLNIVGSLGNVWNLTTKTSVEPRVHLDDSRKIIITFWEVLVGRCARLV